MGTSPSKESMYGNPKRPVPIWLARFDHIAKLRCAETNVRPPTAMANVGERPKLIILIILVNETNR